MNRELDLTAAMIDVETITARIDELREERDASESRDGDGDQDWAGDYPEGAAELAELESIMEDLRGMGGGDHQWEGDWYPGYLIADWYFKEYAQDLADEIGAIDAHAAWPMSCIDWEQAARVLRMDYTSVEVNGHDYWFR